MKAAFRFLITLAVRLDAGFILGRLALVVPLIAVSQSGASNADYAVFAAHYHEALIVSLVVLFGANEAFLVRRFPAPQQGFWQVLVLSFAGILVLWIANGQGWTGFGGGLLAFLAVYRTLYLYFITVSRDDALLYCGLASSLTATAVLVVLEGAPAYWTLLPLLAGVFAATLRLGLLSHLHGAVSGFPLFLKENAPYSLNQLVGAAYVQGALVVYALIAAGTVYLEATQYIYLMSFAVILTQVLYRLFLIKVAKQGGGALWGRESYLQLFAGLVLGVALTVFASEIEGLVFGRALIPDDVVWLLVPTMLVVSLQNVTAAYLVGSGHVRQQFRVSLVAAIGLVALIVLLDWLGAASWTLPAAILTSMAAGVAARLVLATRVRRASGTG